MTMETIEEIQYGADLLADNLLELSEKAGGDRLQALVIASALLGTYSPPFEGVEVTHEEMLYLQEFVMASDVFPLRSRSECVDALVCAIQSHQLGFSLSYLFTANTKDMPHPSA